VQTTSNVRVEEEEEEETSLGHKEIESRLLWCMSEAFAIETHIKSFNPGIVMQ
jgi:hypothetical protein